MTSFHSEVQLSENGSAFRVRAQGTTNGVPWKAAVTSWLFLGIDTNASFTRYRLETMARITRADGSGKAVPDRSKTVALGALWSRITDVLARFEAGQVITGDIKPHLNPPISGT